MSADVVPLHPHQMRRLGDRQHRVASTYPLDLSRADSVERLSEVASDFLFELCGPDGRRKLLEQHELIAA